MHATKIVNLTLKAVIYRGANILNQGIRPNIILKNLKNCLRCRDNPQGG